MENIPVYIQYKSVAGERLIITKTDLSAYGAERSLVSLEFDISLLRRNFIQNSVTRCNAGNRITAINNLFDCFNFKLFGITLTAHGHLSLSNLK